MNAVLEREAAQQETQEIDMQKLEELMGRAIVDYSGALQSSLIVLGDRLGLYKALAEAGPQTSDQLAARTGLAERYVREWLNANAASHYVEYLPRSGRYRMSMEQAAAFAMEDSPAFLVGLFQTAMAAVKITDRLEEAFKSGEGIGWNEHDHSLFHGIERAFRSGYIANLVQSWLPALEGVVAKLEKGARVADVGCGHGASTILMAQAFPNSTFFGYDYHQGSIDVARQRAKAAGVSANVHFEVGSAQDYMGGDYDLVAVFDALHDMGDPMGAAAHIRSTLKPDGTFMIVEPNAADNVEDNIHPVGRAFYAASTLMCTPCALKQGRVALGAQAGEARLRSVVMSGGFKSFRVAARSPINMVLEAKP